MPRTKDALEHVATVPPPAITGFPPPPTSGQAAVRPLVSQHDFRTVYREHFRYVWRSLRRLGLEEQDCADAAQQVFLIVHRKLADFREQARITTWLFAICVNVAANTRRSRGRRRETELEERGLAERSSPHAQSDARLTLERLLDGISLEQRTTFLLYEVEQLSCQEIAKVTQTPVGTVKSRLRLARERIADRLGLELPKPGRDDDG